MTEREAFRLLRWACLGAAFLSTVAAVTAWSVSNSPWAYCLIAAANLAGSRVAAAQVRRIDRETVLATPEIQAMLTALRDISENLGAALTPVIESMNKAFIDIGDAFGSILRAQYPAGTVQNPSDPSPRPRP